MPAQKITTAGFLSDFLSRHRKMADRAFCWVLGSGASLQSGIPTGRTLAMQWLTELQELEDFDGLTLEQWATADRLGISGFDLGKVASFYPFIYQRRFRDFKEQGYAFLEAAMQQAEPSYGYSVLAQIMAKFRHKVAVTTNFDNLIADAIATYTRDYPLVCGHESLTGFIRPNLSRPVIAKIHRDLLLSPKSEPEEIGTLPAEWEAALQVIFDNNTPVVIGYGGNDGSLMGLLRRIAPIKGGIFWCFRVGDEPDSTVHDVVERHHGRMVPVLGFDELMLQLWDKLKLASPIPDLQAAHDKRRAEYQRQFKELSQKLREPGKTHAAEAELKQVRAAADAAFNRLTKEENWWAWELKASAEPDPEKAEAIYREGLRDFPESPELTGNFALFMSETRKKRRVAERLYRKALELDPKNANNWGNFAVFLAATRGKHGDAERLYRKALELDPTHANHLANFANFLTDVRKNPKEAERLYRKALRLDPEHPNKMGDFAAFLSRVRKRHDQAEQLYRKVLKLDPKNVHQLHEFATFLHGVRENYDEAETLFRRALAIDPESAENLRGLALVVEEVGDNNDEVEQLYRKALQLEPGFALNSALLAEFLETRRKSLSEADRLYRQALGVEPDHDWTKEQYTRFLNEHPEFADRKRQATVGDARKKRRRSGAARS